MAECPVCLQKMTKNFRREIQCPCCEYTVCLMCVRKYIVEKQEPHCMRCKTVWTYRFISTTTPFSFYNKQLRDAQVKFMMEREKGLLPATQHLAEREKKRREALIMISELKKQQREYQRITDDLQLTILNLEAEANVTHTRHKDSRLFIYHCPRENCRGFLSKSDPDSLICPLCCNKACAQCFVPLVEPHVCKKEDVESARMICEETRQCPNCATNIFKISGCEQVFCTMCHTAFEYSTGKIATGPIHAPGYYEWLHTRDNMDVQRHPEDVPCGGLPNFNFSISALGAENYFNLCSYYRCLVHCQQVILPKFFTDTLDYNTELRVRYLLGDIDEKKWASLLKTSCKKMERKRAIYAVLQTWINTMIGLFHNLLEKPSSFSEIEKEILALRIYSNDELSIIKTIYHCQTPFIEFHV